MTGSGLITILFTDLVGSTAMAQQLGDAAADELRRAHFDQLRRAVQVTGGTEVKTIGDAMMVSYSSATDAVAGAVAMQQRVHAHNEAGSPVRVEMRIGVSAGDASYEDGDWFGTPVVEASRLCGAADGGQILIADIVRVLAGSRVGHEVVGVGEIHGKGFSEPMPACEVRWEPAVIADRTRVDVPLPPQVVQGDVFGFVGRDDQREALRGAWKDVSVSGRLAVFVGGEPGIGKTRLVKELCRDVHDQDGIVLWGACDEELALPYQPFVEAFRWLADSVPSEVLSELVGSAGGEMVPLIPDIGSRVPSLSPRLADDAETERYRLFEATSDLLQRLSAVEPVVLVLDDLHWARKPTLLLLRHILKSSAAMNLLIVATYRDTDLDRRHPLAEMLADLRREGGVERLLLHGLDEAGVQQFLTAAAGHDLDDRGVALASAIARETEGNPFFVGEVLRHLTESGALEYRDDRWVSDKELHEVGIPEGVREVIGRRLSNLDAAANDALAQAAVIGREFELRVLAAIGGGVDAVLDPLDAAERSGLVEAVNGRPGVYRFAHALVRSALIDELPTTRRLRIHREVGLALEGFGAEASHLAELARHFTEAAALGEVDKAVRYSRMAGDAALADLAYEEAAAHFEQALESLELRTPVDEPQRGELLLAAGTALHQINDPRGLDLLAAAEDLARKVDDIALLARIFIARGSNIFVRERPEVVSDQVELAEAILAQGDDLPPDLRARTMATYANELFWSDQPEKRRALCDEALVIARQVANPKVLADVLFSRSLSNEVTHESDLAQNIDEATEMIDVAAGIDDALVGSAFVNRWVAQTSLGEVDRAAPDLDRAEGLAARLRIPADIFRVKMMRTGQALLAGRLEEVDVLVADLEAYGARHGIASATAGVGSIRYRLQYERGDLGGLEEFLVAVIAAQPAIPVWRMALCGVYLQSDRPELAIPHVEAIGADDFAMVPRNQVFLLTCSSAARFAGELGVLDVADAAYRHAAVADGRFPWTGVIFEYPVGIGVGAAAAALGRLDDAAAHYAAAIDLCERAGAPTYLAAAQVYAAELFRARGLPGDAARARDLANHALRTAQRLGLAYMGTRAERLLGS